MDMTISSFNARCLPFHGWKTIKEKNITYHIAGSGQHLKKIANILTSATGNLSEIDALLRSEKNVFSYLIVSPDFIFSCVDRIKSYPLFYGIDHYQQLHVSNCPYTIKENAHLTKINDNAMLEFSMASYTFGNKTLYQSLYQLQAGEYLLWQRKNPKLITHRYYRYLPKENNTLSYDDLMEEHAVVMNDVIDRVIENAQGGLICLPLSGGLDSRILLTKLIEKKYDRIQAISYGVSGNFEAKMAKHVTEQLEVPWQFIPAKPKLARKLYHTQERFDFAKFISGLHTVPSYLEYETLRYITQKKIIPQDSIIINGQSGDFTTGGHLPRLILEKENPNFNDLLDAAVTKHCSLWHRLVNEKNVHMISEQIQEVFSTLTQPGSKSDLLARYESWEWQERQCKAVIKGQRLYDFFHYDWQLPLWDPALMDFWAKVPFKWKTNQKLYIDYLQKHYPKLFNTLRPMAKPWVTKFKWIPLVAKVYGLLCGDARKSDYYKRMYYYGTDYNQYALIGRKFYLAHYKDTHGLGPFLISLCLEELEILNASKIADTKPI